MGEPLLNWDAVDATLTILESDVPSPNPEPRALFRIVAVAVDRVPVEQRLAPSPMNTTLVG